MTPQDLSQRELFRFTGPPENWITAIKFMTWGLEEKHLSRWQQIEPGDIFLMHSTSIHTMVKGAPSSVIGFGVVSPGFRRKNGPLWLEEVEEHKNKWPLLVPFSEIYLFSKLRPQEMLEAPNGKNNDLIISESMELLSNAVRLPGAFPKMGSISRVKPEVAVEIFTKAERFYLYDSAEVKESYTAPKGLKRVDKPEDIIRKPISLEEMQIIKKKTVRVGTATYTKDLQALEKAETAHHDTLTKLFDLLKTRGYETYYNRHVDLFATRGESSILFEVKSLAKKNFRSQARKGIVQLFEYEYFEIRKFIDDNNSIAKPNKALVFSDAPKDTNYIEFISSLKMGSGYFEGSGLKASGGEPEFAGII